jgi:hypothetical protein
MPEKISEPLVGAHTIVDPKMSSYSPVTRNPKLVHDLELELQLAPHRNHSAQSQECVLLLIARPRM